MTSSRRSSIRRGASALIAAGLLFALSGDRGVTAIPPGIDPLEVLDLQVKPNVIIVLDSSGSMTESPYAGDLSGLDAGDWTRSKMHQAKQVLNQVITANDTKAAFQFGQYTQATSTLQGAGIGGTRFVYETESWAAVGALPIEGPGASMATTELTVLGGGGEGALMAFQMITATNNRLFWRERTSNVNPVAFVNCSVTLPIAFTANNAGTAIATAMTTQMNACVRPATSGAAGTRNTYAVTYVTGANPRFTFTRSAGNRNWNLMWATGGANQAHRIMGFNVTDLPTGAASAASGGTSNAIASAFNAPRVLRRDAATDINAGTFDPDGPTCPAVNPPVQCGPSPARAVRSYSLIAGKFWNGETVSVQTNGVVCAVTAGVPTSPPTVRLQQVGTPCGGVVGQPVTFKWAGADFGGNSIPCNGFQSKVPLRPCDQITPLQITQVSGFLNRTTRLNSTETNPLDSNVGLDTGTVPLDYSEANDGSGFIVTPPASLHPALSAGGLSGGGIPADGSTPVANSLRDIRGTANDPAGSLQRNWTELWFNGQAAAVGPPVVPALSAISTHTNPKERTIVLFITDGDDTCAGQGSGDNDALAAAYQAQLLYDPLVGSTISTPINTGRLAAGSDPASSVQTYLIAFGNGASVNRSNWIAWGGSGMVRPDNGARWNAIPTAAQRALCVTCKDAYVAPDADTLRQALEAVINQGASNGEFTAQSSVADNVYELVAQSAPRDPDGAGPLPAGDPLSPMNADNRDGGVAIMRFISTFTLPTYDGQFKGYTNNGSGTAIAQWNAGQLLTNRVSTGMAGCASSGTPGECMFSELHGGATPENVAASAARIKRRIYTSSRNGVFVGPGAQEIKPDNLTNAGWVQTQGSGGFRVALWPPTTAAGTVAPNGTGAGSLDVPLGLPTTTTATDFTNLQAQFNACRGAISSGQVDAAGSGHPCSSSNSATVRAQQARREAREMILAYTAGAEVVLDNITAFPKRILSGANQGQLLYVKRNWVLGESTLATPAVVGPALDDNSTPCVTPADCPFTAAGAEYKLYTEGVRNASNITVSTTDQGFGLTNPDKDNFLPPAVPPATTKGEDGGPGRVAIKPVMTVVYLGANDMLHAFRAGPSIRSIGITGSAAGSFSNVCTASATVECGGEELWGFVPFDQLVKLKGRMAIPQRDPHVYMIAASIRFADVFVPVAGGGTFTPIVPGVTTFTPAPKGVWRKVIFFGRGIGGKYLTALDVTAPGPFTRLSLLTNGPLVMWNRGNPDTQNGVTGGTPNNTTSAGAGDALAYTKMGQTWSVPAIALIGPGAVPKNTTVRKPEGVPFVAYVGSGYGTSPEGTVFYTLDALTGDIVKTADVEVVAGANGLTRSTAITSKYPNALVANPAAFSAPAVSASASTVGSHPSAAPVTRVYIGDLYGRMWKFLSDDPSVAIPLADLGEDQPVAAPAALLNIPVPPNGPTRPFVYVESGQENRTTVPAAPSGFRYFSLIDDNSSETDTTFPTPISSSINFTDVFQLNYRGTAQPTTVFNDTGLGRVFFVGTRFNEPGSVFAPPPYPCRSSFDSIVYLLGAQSGLAAYDLNSSGQDSFIEYEDSRLNGVQVISNPAIGSTGGTVVLDEGQVTPGDPVIPPPPPNPQPQLVPASIVATAPLTSSAVCK